MSKPPDGPDWPPVRHPQCVVYFVGMRNGRMLSIMLGSGEWADIGREAVFGRCAAWARQRYIVFGDIEDAEWYGHYVTSQCPHVSCRIADADGNVVRTIEDANLWRDQEGREAVLKEMRERRWWQFWKW